MTETDLAAAVKMAVHRWMQATTPTQQKMGMANPATLAALLGLAVQQSVVSRGLLPTAMRKDVLQAPFCHLKAVFDASSLVDTPIGFYPVPDTPGTIAGRAAALAVQGMLHMETVSYGTENDGMLFVNLVAIPGRGAFAEKSKRGMRGHTDAVSFPFNGEDDPLDARIAPSPDLVTLAGLRNPKDVPTKVISLAELLARLSAGDIAELKKPQYSMTSQKTFVPGMKRILGKELVVFDESVLKDIGSGTCIRYSHSNVIPSVTGGPAEQASNNLEAVCSQIAMPVLVQPGDLLVINNRLGLHGRAAVGDEFGGQSRWLLRTYGLDTSNLPAYKRHLGGSPPHVLFP
jgi:L-asparagine oxygenase